MAGVEINWSLLGAPVDVGAQVQKGFETGTRSAAMNALAKTPDNPRALNALLSVDPKAAYDYRDYRRSEAKGRRDEADYARQERGRGALSTFMAGAPVTNALMPDQGTGVAAPGIVQRAPQQPKAELSNPAFRDLVALDPESAFKLSKGFADMDEAGRKAVEAKNEAAGSAAMHLHSFPPEARRAALQQIAPQLMAMGLTADELNNADLSDAGLQSLVTMSMDVKSILAQQNNDRTFELTKENTTADNARADAQFGEQRRHNSVSEGQGERRISISTRNADLSERNSSEVTPSKVIGPLLAKVAAGQSLNPAEQRAFDMYKVSSGLPPLPSMAGGANPAPANIPSGSPLSPTNAPMAPPVQRRAPPPRAQQAPKQGDIVVNKTTGERRQLRGRDWVVIR